MNMANGEDGRKNHENRMIREYLQQNHRPHLQWRQVRVGPNDDRLEAKFAGVLRRWADAIVFDGSKIIIIEGKMRPDPAGLSQLELYRQLFVQTPEFSLYKDKPIELVLVTTIEDKQVALLAESKGIKFLVYKAAWIKEYWNERLVK